LSGCSERRKTLTAARLRRAEPTRNARNVRIFNEELEQRRQKGLVNRISGVKLLQGDLAEAWSEGVDEYATVVMRFSLIDVTQDRATAGLFQAIHATTQSTEV